jgi:hypothetical protein
MRHFAVRILRCLSLKSVFRKVIIHFGAYWCEYQSKRIILSIKVASIKKDKYCLMDNIYTRLIDFEKIFSIIEIPI